MKHPVALTLMATLALVLVGLGGFRALSPPTFRTATTESMDTGRVWGSELPDLAGQVQPLSQWRGKVLVLNFWAPWCPPCRREIPGFLRLQDTYGSRGLQFVGIALDGPDKVQAYAKEIGIDYPVLLGGAAGVELARAAGNHLGGLPYTVVLDRRGRAAATLTGGIDEARLETLIQPLL